MIRCFPLSQVCTALTRKEQSGDNIPKGIHAFPTGIWEDALPEYPPARIIPWDKIPPACRQKTSPVPRSGLSTGKSHLDPSMALFPSSGSLNDSPALHKLIGPRGKREGKKLLRAIEKDGRTGNSALDPTRVVLFQGLQLGQVLRSRRFHLEDKYINPHGILKVVLIVCK